MRAQPQGGQRVIFTLFQAMGEQAVRRQGRSPQKLFALAAAQLFYWQNRLLDVRSSHLHMSSRIVVGCRNHVWQTTHHVEEGIQGRPFSPSHFSRPHLTLLFLRTVVSLARSSADCDQDEALLDAAVDHIWAGYPDSHSWSRFRILSVSVVLLFCLFVPLTSQLTPQPSGAM